MGNFSFLRGGMMFPYWTSLEHDGPQMYVVYI